MMEEEMKFKAYASITKSEDVVSDVGKGVIRFSGWATRLTNPSTGVVEADRDGELVDYSSVLLSAKVLLSHHKFDDFIGKVKLEHKSEGIWFTAEVHETLAPKEYYAVKEGILDSVSIGFRVNDHEFLDIDGEPVVMLKASEIYEVSIVSIPANKHAVIQSNIDQVKSVVKGNKCVGLSCSLKAIKEMNPDCGCLKTKSLEKVNEIQTEEKPLEVNEKEILNMENETVKTVEEPTSIEPVIPVIQVTEPIKEEVVKPEPVVEQPKQEVVQPEKVEPKVESPKSPEITPIQSLVGQLATIDINDMDNEGEIDALLTQVFRISSDAENIAQQLAEMQN